MAYYLYSSALRCGSLVPIALVSAVVLVAWVMCSGRRDGSCGFGRGWWEINSCLSSRSRVLVRVVGGGNQVPVWLDFYGTEMEGVDD